MQGRHLHKELRNQNEDVEVERNRSRGGIYLAPSPSEMKHVARRNGKRQHHRRDDAFDDPVPKEWVYFSAFGQVFQVFLGQKSAAFGAS